MEALAALSIVANVFQVIDFSMNVLSTANELRKAGTTKDQSDISMVADDLKNLNSKLKLSSQSIATQNNLSQDQLDLERLVDRASAIADDLTQLLNHHKVLPGSGRLTSLAKAIQSSWDQNKIMGMTTQLEGIRNELSFRVLVSIRIDLDVVALRNDDRFEQLDDATKKILEAILDNRVILKAELQVNSEELRSQIQTDVQGALDDFNDKADHRHQEVLHTMKHALHNAPKRSSPDEVNTLILSHLNFNQLNDRYEDISPAHKQTFHWIFDSDNQNCSFANWVRNGQEIYWICGKAGSGKSTLMKMIHNDNRLRKGLKVWAADIPLITTSFFFWRNGTEIQRSYRGLLRSLLSQVICANGRLSPILFPYMFETGPNWAEFPSFHDLKRAFKTLTTQKKIRVKVAFLIDGLDEYESCDMGMDSLATIFRDAAKSPNVKMILSGRPIRVLEKSFESYESLRLEHLTSGDISNYVNQQIKEHPDLAAVARTQPDLANELVTEVVQSAAGVFLWVVLVVRSLLEGFQNRDTIQILQERLREIPTDIYNLFTHMLKQVPLRYRTRSAQIFRLHRNIQNPPLLNIEFRFLTALGLSFAFPQTENNISTAGNALSEYDARERIRDIDVQLKTHCAGLLELRKIDSLSGLSLRDSKPEHPFDIPIAYIHRTAADYFAEMDIWSRITEDSKDFDVFIHLLQSWILQITRISIHNIDPMKVLNFDRFFREFIHIAKLVDHFSAGNGHEMLKRLDSILCGALKPWIKDWHWSDFVGRDYNKPYKWHGNFLSFAIRAGLKSFVDREINDHGSAGINKTGRPLLDYAVRPESAYPKDSETIDPRIVALLLAHGGDPNQVFDSWSPWSNVLFSYHGSSLKLEQALEIFPMMISHGGDPNVFINFDKKNAKGEIRRHRLSAMRVLYEATGRWDNTPSKEEMGIICLLEERKGKNRYWVELENGDFELQNSSGEKRIWHDVDGNFVPKPGDRSAVKKILNSLDQMKGRASRRLSKR